MPLPVALLCASGGLVPAAGQGGTVSGTVTDPAGAGVVGAEVALGRYSTKSDEFGRFRLTSADSGGTLVIRRLGFEPLSVMAKATGADNYDVRFTLNPLPTFLPPVVVQTARPAYVGRLSGYYQRLERRNGGTFIPRDQIDRENPRSLSQLLTHVPGINATRMRGGGSGVRMRGRNCWPLVWLDGLPMGTGEVDLDAIPPYTVHGIELYLGSTTAPMRYIGTRNQSSCGTILIWSRGPDTDPVGRQNRPRFDLERMVASLTVFTLDQVDTPARPKSADELDVVYPAELYATGEGGAVIAEFIVSERGRMEDGTFGIVSSTNPRLSEAVRSAVTRAMFTPAVKGGQAVRQVVQQPFSFPARVGKQRGG